jgi:hypothetical protein
MELCKCDPPRMCLRVDPWLYNRISVMIIATSRGARRRTLQNEFLGKDAHRATLHDCMDVLLQVPVTSCSSPLLPRHIVAIFHSYNCPPRGASADRRSAAAAARSWHRSHGRQARKRVPRIRRQVRGHALTATPHPANAPPVPPPSLPASSSATSAAQACPTCLPPARRAATDGSTPNTKPCSGINVMAGTDTLRARACRGWAAAPAAKV